VCSICQDLPRKKVTALTFTSHNSLSVNNSISCQSLMRSCNYELLIYSASAMFETNFRPLVPSSVCTLRHTQFSSWLSPQRQGGSLEPGRESGTILIVVHLVEGEEVGERGEREGGCFTVRPNQSCINSTACDLHYHYHR